MAKRKTALFEVFSSHQPEKPARNWSLPLISRLGWTRPTEGNGDPDAVDIVHPTEDAASARPGLRVSVDSGEQTINVILSYGSAAVASCALVLLIGLAFVMGKHNGRGPLPLLAERTTEEIRQQPPQTDVLDLFPQNTIVPAPIAVTPTPRIIPKGPTFNDPKPPATHMLGDDKRLAGFNYVIVQSYPDPKDAEEAKQLLLKHDILCTVEPTPLIWADPKWKMVSVIGTKGFDRIRSAEFENYVAQIEKVGEQMAGKPKFRRFEPRAYKWREPK